MRSRATQEAIVKGHLSVSGFLSGIENGIQVGFRLVPFLPVLVAVLLGSASLAIAQTETVVYSFQPGSLPYSGVVLDAQGNIYGTTYAGGTSANCTGGCGTLFEITAAGKEIVLHNFRGGTDGASPVGALWRDAQGNLFGTSFFGDGLGTCPTGCGTVFEVTSGGHKRVVHRFRGATTDGSSPYSNLIADGDGNLFGTTSAGGSFGRGTIFEITAFGKEKVLYNFSGGTDGGWPTAGLIRDAKGNFYGTTSGGGTPVGKCWQGCGTVFEFTSDGRERVLYSFTGEKDGWAPFARLLRDARGNLYGTTMENGFSYNCWDCGTVFEIAADGTEETLHRFHGVPDGWGPNGGLVMDRQGNLYGTTILGGRAGGAGCGTVFEITGAGRERILYSFSCSDGSAPYGDLVMDAHGSIYGTTASGGAYQYGGTVFRIQP